MALVHVATPRNTKPPKAAVRARPEKISLRKFIAGTRGIPDEKMSRWVRVVRVDRLTDDEKRKVLRCETVTEKPNTPPQRGHYCSIRPVDPAYRGKLTDCPALIFDCNCHRWMYVWEFAFWYRGAAKLLRGNGDYPEQTNPMLRLGGCKHLINGAKEILSRKL